MLPAVAVVVVPKKVLVEPSGSVEVVGSTVSTAVKDWPGVPDRVSVVPKLVVTDPSDSVKVEGRIVVVKGWLGFSDRVSVVPEMVLRGFCGHRHRHRRRNSRE